MLTQLVGGMAMVGLWQVTVSDDSDSTGEKTAIATWTEPTGVFTYSTRANATQAAANAFVAAAIIARNAWQAKRVILATQSTILLNKFNANDPQIGG